MTDNDTMTHLEGNIAAYKAKLHHDWRVTWYNILQQFWVQNTQAQNLSTLQSVSGFQNHSELTVTVEIFKDKLITMLLMRVIKHDVIQT